MSMQDYVCNECGYTEEFIISFSLPKPEIPDVCPKCNKGKMEQKFSGKNIGFKCIGAGFHCNDYKNK